MSMISGSPRNGLPFLFDLCAIRMVECVKVYLSILLKLLPSFYFFYSLLSLFLQYCIKWIYL